MDTRTPAPETYTLTTAGDIARAWNSGGIAHGTAMCTVSLNGRMTEFRVADVDRPPSGLICFHWTDPTRTTAQTPPGSVCVPEDAPMVTATDPTSDLTAEATGRLTRAAVGYVITPSGMGHYTRLLRPTPDLRRGR